MKKIFLFILTVFFISVHFMRAIEYEEKTYCNPLNLDYGWGCFLKDRKTSRSAADPVIVLFKGKYYLFTTYDIGGYRVSDDLMTWKNVYFDSNICPYALDGDHYIAPAVAADSNYVYFVNFTHGPSKKKVDVIRSSNPETGIWEKCGEIERLSDPCLFIDNKRFYFFFGLGPEHPTTVFEVNPTNFEEIPGTRRVLRKYIKNIDECRSGYHLGRRELFDEIDASAWQGHFRNLPCPEGAWIIRNKDKYYLQYATPGTICNWYCDIVMQSDSADRGFVEQLYNPVSLKVGGFIGGAGHSCVFKDKYENWWQVTTMWVGNDDEFERRIGLFPVSFDKKGRMRVHTVLGDYPIVMPQKYIEPHDIPILGWMIQSYKKECIASSSLSGFNVSNATDENVRTWWSAETGNPGEYFIMNLGKKVRINSFQLNFAEQDINQYAAKETDYHAYKVYVSDDGYTWNLLIDKSTNRTAVPHDYIELDKPINASFVKVENIHTPKNGKFALLDLRGFGYGFSNLPGKIERPTVKRNLEDERFAELTWPRVLNADGYLIRFGYQPDFLNQSIQVKGNETDKLLLHILTKGMKYYYRIDSYNDSGITLGNVISD